MSDLHLYTERIQKIHPSPRLYENCKGDTSILKSFFIVLFCIPYLIIGTAVDQLGDLNAMGIIESQGRGGLVAALNPPKALLLIILPSFLKGT